MNKALRWLIASGLLLAVLVAAGGRAAWAGQVHSEPQTVQSAAGQVGSAASEQKGTVKPPPPEVFSCEPGEYPVGGPAVIRATKLTNGYCFAANLKPPFARGRLPEGAGDFLSDTVLLRYYRNNTLQYELPSESGEVKVCFAVPPGTQAPQIYFYDFYGPRFHGGQGQPEWVLVETTVENGIACAPATTSGSYALVGN